MQQLAILVISCDRYADAWDPFFSLMARFWPDCPYPIYLGTNNAAYQREGVRVLCAGEDLSWADNAAKWLDQIPESHVLTFLEDFFLCARIDGSAVKAAFELAVEDGIDLYSLMLPKKAARYKDRADIFHIDPLADYCINTSIAIRRKEEFRELLVTGYSAWDFEAKNSRKARETGAMPGLFVTSAKDMFKVRNGIWRGKWVPGSVRYCRRLGISIDTSLRPPMNFNELAWETAKVTGRRLMPQGLRKAVKRALVRMGFGGRFVSPD